MAQKRVPVPSARPAPRRPAPPPPATIPKPIVRKPIAKDSRLRVLVAGGSGLIGTELAQQLTAYH